MMKHNIAIGILNDINPNFVNLFVNANPPPPSPSPPPPKKNLPCLLACIFSDKKEKC